MSQIASELDAKLSLSDDKSKKRRDYAWTEKDIIERGCTGTVVRFVLHNGFGVIKSADGNTEYFAHQSSIKAPNPKHLVSTLQRGESVTFDVIRRAGDGEKAEAVNVTGPNGAAVLGYEHAPTTESQFIPPWALRSVPIASHAHHYGQRRMRVEKEVKNEATGETHKIHVTEFEDKFKDEDIVERGVIGKVTKFILVRGFGFIARDTLTNDEERDKEAFVHHTDILKPNPNHLIESLGKNEEVKYDLVKTDRGLEAVNVTSAHGGAVAGHPVAPEKGERVPTWCVQLVYGFVPLSLRKRDRNIKALSIFTKVGGRGEDDRDDDNKDKQPNRRRQRRSKPAPKAAKENNNDKSENNKEGEKPQEPKKRAGRRRPNLRRRSANSEDEQQKQQHEDGGKKVPERRLAGDSKGDGAALGTKATAGSTKPKSNNNTSKADVGHEAVKGGVSAV